MIKGLQSILAYLALLTCVTSFPQPLMVIISSPDTSDAGRTLESKGYRTENHLLETSDGYYISLLRIINPKIKRRDKLGAPMYFVPGEYGTASNYLTFTDNITEPKDYSDHDAGSMSQEQLEQLLRDDPSRNVLATLASNFHRDVWMHSRRGTLPSQKHIKYNAYKRNASRIIGSGLGEDKCKVDRKTKDPNEKLADLLHAYENKNVDPNYWSFSLDEVALIDIPESIDYILRYTNQQKLDYVGHSTGGAVLLMLLSERPEYARSISHATLLAPSLYQQSAYLPAKLEAVAIQSGLINYRGPWNMDTLTPCVNALKSKACYQKYGKSRCNFKDEPRPEQVGDNQAASDRFAEIRPSPVGVRQYIQVAQEKVRGKMSKYDFGSREANLAEYGQEEPPEYEVSRIKLNSPISIYHGAQDSTVTPGDVKRLIADLKTPVIQHFVNQTNLFFAHRSVIIHEYVSKYVVLPSFLEMEADK